jgi:hypothetical protein
MKYMLLIHQGSTPTPPSDAWEALSDEEKGAVYGAYKAINENPGVTSGLQLAAPELATTVRVAGRQDADHGRSVRRDQGGARRLLLFEADDLDAAIELAARIPAARMGGAIEVRPLVEW